MNLSFTTIFTTLGLISATVMGIMASALGCHTPDPATTAAPICDAPWLMSVPGDIAKYAALVFGLLAFVSRLFGAGGPLANMVAPKAVILPENHPKSGIGTVTPAQVAQP